MKIDLTKEFEFFQPYSMAPTEELDYICIKLLDALQGAIGEALMHFYDMFPGCDMEELPQAELESFLTAGLVNKLVERLRISNGHALNKAVIMRKLTGVTIPRRGDTIAG